MTKIATESLLNAVHAIGASGQFASHAVLPLVDPGIEIEDGAKIVLPLTRSQVLDIQEAGEPAPFGKGTETYYDESVRRCWQVDAEDFTCAEPEWDEVVDVVAGMVGEDLGVEGTVVAEPYKLLLYGKGGFFLPHRDTEKVDGMFATLIVALPSEHSGGKLIVRHEGKRKVIDFAKKENSESLQYAAFFADCEHEVKPVTSGYRLCLVYNLILEPSEAGGALEYTEEAASLAPHLKVLGSDVPEDISAIFLEHRYTPGNFSLGNLKAADRDRATALLAAAAETGFTAALALATFHQMGELEGGDFGYGSRYDDDDDDGTMGEVYEEDLTLDSWWGPGGKPPLPGTITLGTDRVLALEEPGSGDPDEKQGEGWTGNAGCTMDYWYYRAAIVLWPEDAKDSILAKYAFSQTLASWSRRAKPGAATAGFLTRGHALIKEASERDMYTENAQALFTGIAKSGNRELLDACHHELLEKCLRHFDRPLWKSLFSTFGSEHFTKALTSPSKSDYYGGGSLRDATAAALDALSSLKGGPPPLATALAAWLAGQIISEKEITSIWNRKAPTGNLRSAIAASHLLDTKTRVKLTTRALGDGSLHHLRETLVPTLLDRPREWKNLPEDSIFPGLLASTRKQLSAECARAIEPFADWRRPTNPEDTPSRATGRHSDLAKLITELETFLTDPTAESQSFACRQDLRSSIERHISEKKLDLECRTEKSSRPYALVCTKIDASYGRSLKRRKLDEALLDRLDALG